MPHTPTMSASGSSGTDSTFSSTMLTCQWPGVSAASVASPSGGLSVRLLGTMVSTAQRKLQKLSGKRGLMSSSFMARLRPYAAAAWRLRASSASSHFGQKRCSPAR